MKMNESLLYGILFASSVCVIFLGIFIICALRKRSRLSAIYASRVRDERFANSLLSFVFGKKIIKNPYILRNCTDTAPGVCAAMVCSGGIALISIRQGAGEFIAPDSGSWSVTENGRTYSIPNLIEHGQAYIAELSNLMMRKSLNCPSIRHYIFLTDDHASFDFRSSDCVFTGPGLINELKAFAEFGALNSREVAAVSDLIVKNSEMCKAAYSKAASEKIADADVKIAPINIADILPVPEDAFDTSDGKTAELQPADSDFETAPAENDNEESGKTVVINTVGKSDAEKKDEFESDGGDDDDDGDDEEFSIGMLFGAKKH